MKKDTSELLKELEGCSDFKSFRKENLDSLQPQTLSTYLNELLKIKSIKKSEAVKRSELNVIYAYQIFSGYRVPERSKLLCLAIGLQLNLAETQAMLKYGGYATLYAKNEYDCIIIYGICKKLSVVELNMMLYEYGFETLG